MKIQNNQVQALVQSTGKSIFSANNNALIALCQRVAIIFTNLFKSLCCGKSRVSEESRTRQHDREIERLRANILAGRAEQEREEAILRARENHLNGLKDQHGRTEREAREQELNMVQVRHQRNVQEVERFIESLRQGLREEVTRILNEEEPFDLEALVLGANAGLRRPLFEFKHRLCSQSQQEARSIRERIHQENDARLDDIEEYGREHRDQFPNYQGDIQNFRINEHNYNQARGVAISNEMHALDDFIQLRVTENIDQRNTEEIPKIVREYGMRIRMEKHDAINGMSRGHEAEQIELVDSENKDVALQADLKWNVGFSLWQTKQIQQADRIQLIKAEVLREIGANRDKQLRKITYAVDLRQQLHESHEIRINEMARFGERFPGNFPHLREDIERYRAQENELHQARVAEVERYRVELMNRYQGYIDEYANMDEAGFENRRIQFVAQQPIPRWLEQVQEINAEVAAIVRSYVAEMNEYFAEKVRMENDSETSLADHLRVCEGLRAELDNGRSNALVRIESYL